MLSTQALGGFIGTEDEQSVIDAIAGFVCKDKDVEYFLKNKAFEFERRDKSRTYLVFDEDSELIAYFTLSLKFLEFREELSKRNVREIDGFSKDVNGVAIALIGQFGKDEYKASAIRGKDLMDLCVEKIYQVHKIIGGRYVLIECNDIDKVVGFYKDNGFVLLQMDKTDNYLQMVRRL